MLVKNLFVTFNPSSGKEKLLYWLIMHWARSK